MAGEVHQLESLQSTLEAAYLMLATESRGDGGGSGVRPPPSRSGPVVPGCSSTERTSTTDDVFEGADSRRATTAERSSDLMTRLRRAALRLWFCSVGLCAYICMFFTVSRSLRLYPVYF